MVSFGLHPARIPDPTISARSGPLAALLAQEYAALKGVARTVVGKHLLARNHVGEGV